MYSEGQGILAGSAIEEAIEDGHITIDPFDAKLINPASIDVRLGTQIIVYQAGVAFKQGWQSPTAEDLEIEDGINLSSRSGIDPRHTPALDLSKEDEVYTIKRQVGDKFLIRPGIGYLMHTQEVVGSTRYVPVIDGKSSIGRKFVSIHQTAGYCDAYFLGHITLEISCISPTWLVIGSRIAQVRFHSILGTKHNDGSLFERDRYKGRYKGETAIGAVPSRSWEQLTEQGITKV
jgi:deoxycytidine triphosphate deaminase